MSLGLRITKTKNLLPNLLPNVVSNYLYLSFNIAHCKRNDGIGKGDLNKRLY